MISYFPTFVYLIVLVTEHEVVQHCQRWGLHHLGHPHLYPAVLRLADEGFQIATQTATSHIRRALRVQKGAQFKFFY